MRCSECFRTRMRPTGASPYYPTKATGAGGLRGLVCNVAEYRLPPQSKRTPEPCIAVPDRSKYRRSHPFGHDYEQFCARFERQDWLITTPVSGMSYRKCLFCDEVWGIEHKYNQRHEACMRMCESQMDIHGDKAVLRYAHVIKDFCDGIPPAYLDTSGSRWTRKLCRKKEACRNHWDNEARKTKVEATTAVVERNNRNGPQCSHPPFGPMPGVGGTFHTSDAPDMPLYSQGAVQQPQVGRCMYRLNRCTYRLHRCRYGSLLK